MKLNFIKMDRSDLQVMIRFARKNGAMNRPFLTVFKWYNIAYSLAYNERTLNTMDIKGV